MPEHDEYVWHCANCHYGSHVRPCASIIQVLAMYNNTFSNPFYQMELKVRMVFTHETCEQEEWRMYLMKKQLTFLSISIVATFSHNVTLLELGSTGNIRHVEKWISRGYNWIVSLLNSLGCNLITLFVTRVRERLKSCVRLVNIEKRESVSWFAAILTEPTPEETI